MSIEPKEGIARFWNSQQGTSHTATGFGGGHELEADYRTYFEWKNLKRIVSFNRNMSSSVLGYRRHSIHLANLRR